MVVWHNTPDALRIPDVVHAGDHVSLWIGTWPIEPGQSVLVDLRVRKAGGEEMTEQRSAEWHSNDEPRNNSYWVAHLGSFESGENVQYTITGSVREEKVNDANTYSFEVL